MSQTSVPLAIVDVSVIPMDTDRVLDGQTVIIRGDLIAAIGDSAKVSLPEDAVRIDGRGKFLIPGLIDAHVHAESTASLALFVAHGVTTIRNMVGSATHLAWREQTKRGALFGPSIITAGELIDGGVAWNGTELVENGVDADRVISAQRRRGYDFVKFYQQLTPQAFEAVVLSAKAHGFELAGHVPDRVGLEKVLAARVSSIEHLTGYLEFIEADDSPGKGKLDRASRIGRADHVDPSKIELAAKLTAASGVWNCVTLVNSYRKVPPTEIEVFQKAPVMHYVAPLLAASWDPGRDFRTRMAPPEFWKSLRAGDRVRAQLVNALYKAGAPLVVGTDMANPFVVPGESVHLELEHLVAAGLTPFDALAAATSRSGEFLHGAGESGAGEFGTVSEGRRADLILVRGNPLVDITNTRKIDGVFLRGQWLPRRELDRRLSELEASFTQKHTPPVLAASPGERSLLYSLRFNDRPFATERVQLGADHLRSKLVTDGPDAVSFETHVGLDDAHDPTKVEVSRDSAFLSAKLYAQRASTGFAVRTNAPFGEGAEHALRDLPLAPASRAMAGNIMAGMIVMLPKFIGLKVGESRVFEVNALELNPEAEVGAATWSVERKADEAADRSFEVEVKGRNWHESRTAKVDQQGEITEATFDILIATITAKRE